MAESYPIVYIYQSFFTHSFVDGHLGCFYILAIVNSAAMNIGVHVTFSIMVFLGYMPSSGIVRYMVVLVLVFKGITTHCLSYGIVLKFQLPSPDHFTKRQRCKHFRKHSTGLPPQTPL